MYEPQLTTRGCISLLALTALAGLLLFTFGLVIQIGWEMMTTQAVVQATVTPLATPTAAAPTRPANTATPTTTPIPFPTVTATATLPPTETVTPEPTYEIYVVEAGDTLARIAETFGVTVEAILEANPDLENPNEIFVGQELRIPSP